MSEKKSNPADVFADEVARMEAAKKAEETRRRECLDTVSNIWGIPVDQIYKALEDLRIYNKFWRGK